MDNVALPRPGLRRSLPGACRCSATPAPAEEEDPALISSWTLLPRPSAVLLARCSAAQASSLPAPGSRPTNLAPVAPGGRDRPVATVVIDEERDEEEGSTGDSMTPASPPAVMDKAVIELPSMRDWQPAFPGLSARGRCARSVEPGQSQRQWREKPDVCATYTDGQYLRISDPPYEQVLDSLAMVATHTPLPLLEALLKWRESESPKGANEAASIQRKLAVECIFCSACIHFVESCPPNGLPESLWLGLEEFVFDWLINADRRDTSPLLVSQAEYSSLVDLRSFLLDHVAQLLGALAVTRFDSVTTRFLSELDARACDGVPERLGGLSGMMRQIPVVEVFTTAILQELSGKRLDLQATRSELLSIIHGMRYLRLPVETREELLASRNFVVKANPLMRVPSKRKTELQHALCAMLTAILAPLADRWPPPGISSTPTSSKSEDAPLVVWHEAVSFMRFQLSQWIERSTKHLLVGYPLIALLLCLGDYATFDRFFTSTLDSLYKLLKEKTYRSMALDGIHRLVRFYLNVYGPSQSTSRVWVYLQDAVGFTDEFTCVQGVASHLLSALRKGLLVGDGQHDVVVDLCVSMAAVDVDFAMTHLVMELLRHPDSLGEIKVVGIRALLAVVQSILQPPSFANAAEAATPTVTHSMDRSPSSGLPPQTPGTSPRLSPAALSPSLSSRGLSLQQGLSLSSDAAAADGPLGQYLTQIRAAIGAIIKACHNAYGQALLTTTRPPSEPLNKEKEKGWVVFRWALKCVPHLIPEKWRDDKMTTIIPAYAISIEPGVREEAVQVLFRTVQDLPQSRFAVVRGMANFILRIPDDYPLLIHTSLQRLVQLLNAWRACLVEEAGVQSRPAASMPSSETSTAESEVFTAGREESQVGNFDPSGMEAVGLIFLCSTDIQTRRMALELLYCIRALRTELAEVAARRSIRPIIEQTFVIDVLEETGEDIVQQCYWDIGTWHDLRSEWEPAPADVTLRSVLEGPDRARWARCLSELVKHVAELFPAAVMGARLEVAARLAAISPTDTAMRERSSYDDGKIEQWLCYAMFACACPPEDAPDGGVQSIKDLMHLVLPALKSGSDAQLSAARLAAGHAHPDACEVVLSELSSYVDELHAELERNRTKWKSQRPREEEIRVFEAQVYMRAADGLWPSMLEQKGMLRMHFLRFLDDLMRQIDRSATENFLDTQPLRFCLASVVKTLAVDLVQCSPQSFDTKLRKRLFDHFASWCQDPAVLTGQQGNSYWREVERVKATHMLRTKDATERAALEKEIIEQLEAIQWAAMTAMGNLLYGPCFDDGMRRMSGKVVNWIKGLLMEPPSSGKPLGIPSSSPLATRMILSGPVQFQQRTLGSGLLTEKERSKGSWRVLLAKMGLLNLLQTNLDLFPACIDQCYSPDPSVADGYFSVLAEVYMRHHIPKCDIQRLLSLILYKVVDPSRQIRDDALQMLETLSLREWSEEGEGARYRAAVVGSLPDSYQQFQFQLSAKLAKEHPELSELLCEEIMQRQLDAVDIIAQHQVLTCMAPWMENLNFAALWESGWSERLLKSLYYVTWKHGDQFPDEIEKLWSTVAARWRNIVPVLDFLITKGIEDCDSNASGEISEALVTYFSVAKRISLYLARISPQSTIDHLVYELAQRMLEEDPDPLGDRQQMEGSSGADLEFVQDPVGLSEADAFKHPSTATSSLLDTTLSSHWGPFAFGRGGLAGSGGAGGRTTPNGHLPQALGWVSHSSPVTAPHRPLSSSSHKGHHGSRDSGDGFSFLEPLAPLDAASAHLTGPAAQPRFDPMAGHHWVSRAGIALILLAEIAYENDEDFRPHLPLLFHVTFVSMDSTQAIVLEHCQQLLVNLLYSLAGRHLELYDGSDRGDGEYKQQASVVSLIKYVQSKKGSLMWEVEHATPARTALPSASLLSSLVLSVVDAIFFQGDLRERWGEEALKWAMECTSGHMAARSHQIYRALRPAVTTDTCVMLLRCLHRCFFNPTPPVLGFVMEILLTLQVMVDIMVPEKIILYPQMFWGCIALLHTNFVYVYTEALRLFIRVIDLLSFDDPTLESVLLANMPQDELSSDSDFEPSVWRTKDRGHTATGADQPEFERKRDQLFFGVQTLVLKGLLSEISHSSAVEVLVKTTSSSCDRIFGDQDARLLMQIVGLFPWQCHQLGSSIAAESSLAKARALAANLAHWCTTRGLAGLAEVFQGYAQGLMTSMEVFVDRIAPLLCAEWFPKHSTKALRHLLCLLERGPEEYQQIILLLLRALLQHTAIDAAQSLMVYTTVARLLEGHLCQEALNVLEAVLSHRSLCTDNDSAQMRSEAASAAGHGSSHYAAVDLPAGPPPVRRASDETERRGGSWSQMRFLGGGSGGAGQGARMGGGGAGVAGVTGGGHSRTRTASWGGGFPSSLAGPEVVQMTGCEASVLNTRLALGRVLETYGQMLMSTYSPQMTSFVSHTSRQIWLLIDDLPLMADPEAGKQEASAVCDQQRPAAPAFDNVQRGPEHSCSQKPQAQLLSSGLALRPLASLDGTGLWPVSDPGLRSGWLEGADTRPGGKEWILFWRVVLTSATQLRGAKAMPAIRGCTKQLVSLKHVGTMEMRIQGAWWTRPANARLMQDSCPWRYVPSSSRSARHERRASSLGLAKDGAHASQMAPGLSCIVAGRGNLPLTLHSVAS
eukprot:SM000176S03137  [mRNA]  locus=s176:102016:119238:- [translate_table: standard]